MGVGGGCGEDCEEVIGGIWLFERTCSGRLVRTRKRALVAIRRLKLMGKSQFTVAIPSSNTPVNE